MAEKFVRIYQKLDVSAIKAHLLVYGALSGTCENCNTVDIKLDVVQCPKCETEFKYVAFRQPGQHIPKMYKLSEERPQIKMIDFDDYKKNLGASKAENFFK